MFFDFFADDGFRKEHRINTPKRYRCRYWQGDLLIFKHSYAYLFNVRTQDIYAWKKRKGTNWRKVQTEACTVYAVLKMVMLEGKRGGGE